MQSVTLDASRISLSDKSCSAPRRAAHTTGTTKSSGKPRAPDAAELPFRFRFPVVSRAPALRGPLRAITASLRCVEYRSHYYLRRYIKPFIGWMGRAGRPPQPPRPPIVYSKYEPHIQTSSMDNAHQRHWSERYFRFRSIAVTAVLHYTFSHYIRLMIRGRTTRP